MGGTTPRRSLEDLLAEQVDADRARVEREKELAKHSVERAILFTDIVGSTEYFEKYGDVAGMTLLKRHDSLLHPLVPAHRGRIVKTIGDAIMAVFEDPVDAVQCGIGMQEALRDEREHRHDEPLHVRIGIHAGRVFLKDEDVFGDTVNTAARINHEAHSDEVLLSRSLWDRIPERARPHGVPRGELALKGKSEPVPVVGIPFASADDGPIPSPDLALDFQPSRDTSPELFVLEIARGARGLKVSAIDGAADKGVVKAYEEQPIEAPELEALGKSFEAFMAPGAPDSYRERIAESGRALFKRALSDRARRHLASTSLLFLRLHLDDDLVHVPWELMHDGKQFLALRFAVGRIVAARADDSPRAATEDMRGHVLVVSDPSGGLPAAANEGRAIAGLLRDGWAGEVRHLEGPVTKSAFFKALRGCRLLHFAGHSQGTQGSVRGGFVLADGVATPEEIGRACGDAAPRLVFANSCSASTRQGWTDSAVSYNLASGFLMRGSQHFIGPMWDVPDEDALAFALRFYENALSGVEFGEAVRAARTSIALNGTHPLAFAGYVLYGQPRTSFNPAQIRLEGSSRMRSASQASVTGTRVPLAREPVTRDSHQLRAPGAGTTSRTSPMAIAALLTGGAALVMVGAYTLVHGHGGENTPPGPPPGAASAWGKAPPPPITVATPVAMVAATERHQGPLRVAVLPFKDLSQAKGLDVGAAMQESIVTDAMGIDGVKVFEQGQADKEQHYLFDETWAQKWIIGGKEIPRFDHDSLAALGELKGAEVVVVGAWQRSGKALRANARVVDTETGEVLATLKVDRTDGDELALQDALAAQSRKALVAARGKLRPGDGGGPR